jgi:predicted phage-related endonuclease
MQSIASGSENLSDASNTVFDMATSNIGYTKRGLPPGAVDLTAVRAQVELLHWVKGRIAELKEVEKAAREQIEDAMGASDTGLLDGELAISWGTHKRTSFDQKAFRDAHPDTFEAYKTTTEVRRFEILDLPKKDVE